MSRFAKSDRDQIQRRGFTQLWEHLTGLFWKRKSLTVLYVEADEKATRLLDQFTKGALTKAEWQRQLLAMAIDGEDGYRWLSTGNNQWYYCVDGKKWRRGIPPPFQIWARQCLMDKGSLETEIENLQDRVHLLRQEIMRLDTKQRSLSDEVQNLEHAAASARRENAELEKQRQRLRDAVAHLEAEKTHLESTAKTGQASQSSGKIDTIEGIFAKARTKK